MKSCSHTPNKESNNTGLRELNHPWLTTLSSLNKEQKRKSWDLIYSTVSKCSLWGEKDGAGGGRRVIENNHELDMFGKVQPRLGGFMNI